MRALLALLMTAGSVEAWEFRADDLCRLSHVEPALGVEVTYDPAARLYAIHLDRVAGWPDDRAFRIAFDGPAPLIISTDRHVVDGGRLSVTDRGFGNVLNGLQYNSSATAILGQVSESVSLNGAAPEVEKFRPCTEARIG